MNKQFDISDDKPDKDNISDLKVYGDGDTWRLLCKASSNEEGWMKSTKVCNVLSGCLVQVTTQQRNPDGSYACAEALSYVPGSHIDIEANPKTFKHIPSNYYRTTTTGHYDKLEEKANKYDELMKDEKA